MPDQSANNVHELGAFNADDMLNEIVDLRLRVIQAWRERAVMLTREEQRLLLEEIKLTCQLLGDLAH
jgi:hypothetical protein